MMKKQTSAAVCLSALLMLFMAACDKKVTTFPVTESSQQALAPFEELITDEQADLFAGGSLLNNLQESEPRDSCCKITLTGTLPDGTLYYSVKNPATPTYYARRRISVIDADYGGILYQYSWGVLLYTCSKYNVKTHLGSIVQTSLSNCHNRYQALMELQTKTSNNGPWVTCSSSLSPVFTLGTNDTCE